MAKLGHQTGVGGAGGSHPGLHFKTVADEHQVADGDAAASRPLPHPNTPKQAIDEIRSLDQNDYAIASRGDHVRGNNDVCRTLCNWRGRPVSGAG